MENVLVFWYDSDSFDYFQWDEISEAGQFRAFDSSVFFQEDICSLYTNDVAVYDWSAICSAPKYLPKFCHNQ